jgi:hypothetical protein
MGLQWGYNDQTYKHQYVMWLMFSDLPFVQFAMEKKNAMFEVVHRTKWGIVGL